MICIIRKNIMYGGAELLIERLAQTIASEGGKVVVVCDKLSATMKSRFIKGNICYVQIGNWYDSSSWRKMFEAMKIGRIITTWIHDYLYVDMVKYQLKINVPTIHYIITSNDLIVGKSISNQILHKLFYEYYRKIIMNMHSSGINIYMDEESVELPEKYYRIKLKKPIIQRLPYNCHKIDTSNVDDNRIPNFTILSIFRADLYIKGYVIGLLGGFPEFLKSHPNAYLELVTFGEDITKIEKIISQFNDRTKEHITLHGKMDYEDLDEVWKKASVYVGMGTTILDAADKGIIALPVAPYTELFCCEGLFSDNPMKITSAKEPYISGYSIIKKIYEMDKVHYLEGRVSSNKALMDYYDISETIDTIRQAHVSKTCIKRWTKVEMEIEKGFLKKDDSRNASRFEEMEDETNYDYGK